jgi:adenylate cyclase
MATPASQPRSLLRRLLCELRAHRWQIALTYAVFGVFLAVASGQLELFLDVDSGPSTLAAIATTAEFALLLLVGTLMSLLLPLCAPISGSLLTFACTLPVLWVGFQSIHRPLIPMEFSLLTILVLYVVHVLMSYFREASEKQQLIGIFGQYVPPELAARLSRDPGAFDLRGEVRELSILFCDVQDFTRHAEGLEPGELSALLNALLTPLTEIVHRHEGTIDKYMGDAMMAFWGAPLADSHHAAHAVSAAYEMQDAVQRLGVDFERRGWPLLSLGVGINTGMVHVGNMGSRYRMAYTAIGDAVNLASRLENLTRVFKVPIIVAESTRRQFPAATYRELGWVQVKGKQGLTRIYEPMHPGLDAESTALARLTSHNRALSAYYDRDWDAAERRFRRLHDARPDDPLYPHYLERIQAFRASPPPDGWRGELRFEVV